MEIRAVLGFLVFWGSFDPWGEFYLVIGSGAICGLFSLYMNSLINFLNTEFDGIQVIFGLLRFPSSSMTPYATLRVAGKNRIKDYPIDVSKHFHCSFLRYAICMSFLLFNLLSTLSAYAFCIYILALRRSLCHHKI